MNFYVKLAESCKRVFKELNFGLKEECYQNALMCELEARGIKSEKEVELKLNFLDSNGKEHFISNLRMDILISSESCLLELKTLKTPLKMFDKEWLQTQRYKKISGMKNAYLINFSLNDVSIIEV